MSSRLVCDFEEVGVRPELARSFRRVFKRGFSFITTIPISVQFLKKDRTWTTIEAILDAEASISLFSKQVEEIEITDYVSHGGLQG